MNPTSLLISFIAGVLIPLLTAVVTRETLPDKVRALILLLFSTAAGIVTGIVTTPPHNWHEWEQVLLTIGVTYIAAASSLVATWLPTKTLAAIHKVTDPKLGLGVPPVQKAEVTHGSA